MNRFERAVLCAVPLGFVGTEVVARLAGLHHFPFAVLSPYSSFPLFTAAAIITALSTLRRREWPRFLVFVTAFEATKALVLLAQHRNLLDSWSTMGIGAWYAAIALSLWSVTSGPKSERLREFDLGLVRLALPIGVILSLFGLALTGDYIESTYDNFLYAFDGLLLGHLAQRLADWCNRSPILWAAAFACYQSFWLVLSVFVYALCRSEPGRAGQLMTRWTLAGLVGWWLYFVLPGIGPNMAFYAHSGTTASSPAEVYLSTMLVTGDSPRNAMPSLHMAWALLLAMTGWEMARRWFAVGVVFCALTVFATLGLAEHYLIDLIAAVPFAVAINALPALFDRDQPRAPVLRAVIGGVLLTGLLLLIVRFATEPLRDAAWLADATSIGIVLASLALHPTSRRRWDHAGAAALP
ncbi:MAG: phosphatase PAP2 family protein [Proteobacteria bacterium]|nr:phosphatase PAP2 family protein [Pseudomonadota bacterium]